MSELGIYTSILQVDVPASANAGETVHLTVQIQNITPDSLDVDVTVSGLPEVIDLGEQVFQAWDFKTFETDFIMPPASYYPSGVVTLAVRSLVWTDTGNWYNDAQAYRGINFGVAPPPATWQKLGGASVTVDIVTTPPPVSTWQKLGGASISIDVGTPTTPGWQKLGGASVVEVSPGLDLTGYNLIKGVSFPEGSTYSGPAQEVTSYFEAPEISWVEDQIVSAFVKAAGDHGAVVLSFKLYQKPGFVIGRYILVMTAYQKAAAGYGGARFFDPVTWGIIILAALIVLGIVAATFFVAQVKELVWGPPGKENPIFTTGLIIGGLVLVGAFVVLPALKKKPT